MRLIIEIATAALLVYCISVSSAAFAAAGKIGRSADGLSCTFSVPANASPAARCGAIRAMWRKIFGKLLQRQDAVGDVSFEKISLRRPGEGRDLYTVSYRSNDGTFQTSMSDGQRTPAFAGTKKLKQVR